MEEPHFCDLPVSLLAAVYQQALDEGDSGLRVESYDVGRASEPTPVKINFTLPCLDCARRGLEESCAHRVQPPQHFQSHASNERLERMLSGDAEAYGREIKSQSWVGKERTERVLLEQDSWDPEILEGGSRRGDDEDADWLKLNALLRALPLDDIGAAVRDAFIHRVAPDLAPDPFADLPDLVPARRCACVESDDEMPALQPVARAADEAGGQ
jgi:hypothetical protein